MDDVSLVSGAIPIALLILGAAALLGLLLPRRPRPWWITLAVGVAAAVISLLGLNPLLIAGLRLFPDNLPTAVVVWLSIGVGAVALTVGNLVHTSARRKVMAGGCCLLLLLTAGSQVNVYFRQYSTLADLTGASTADVGSIDATQGRSGSRFEVTPVVSRWKGSTRAVGGTVSTVHIPGTASGFVAREAYVYLPEIYHVDNPPLLPVLVVVAGVPGAPQNWVVSGRLRQSIDAFAARHNGLAPVTVVVDPNGSDTGNTMCMDSNIANADTYLARDVPSWIVAHLRVDSNFAHWAFGGWSFGGTCALQMATRHPDVYPSFIDLAGEGEPAISPNRQETITLSFGGDTARFDALTPLNVMAQHRFSQVWGVFAAGGGESESIRRMNEVSAAATKSGIRVHTIVVPGEGHSWAVPIAALGPALDWLGPRQGFVDETRER